MFSVTPEPAASKPAYDPQARQPRADQQSSGDFASLIDSNAAAASESRSAPDAPPPPRNDQRDPRRADTPQANNDAPRNDASSAPNDNSSPSQQDTASSTPADPAAGDKTPGKVKASSGDKKAEGEKAKDAEAAADAAVITPTVTATVADAVAVVVAVVTAPVATPVSSDDTESAPTAIAASAAATAAAAIAAASSSTQKTEPALAETPAATATTTTDTGTTIAAELAATASTDSATPGADAAKIVAATGVIHSATGKTEVSAKNTETAATVKESKDGKNDKSAVDHAGTVTDQAIKPETGASNADGKPAQQDKLGTGTAAQEHTAKAAPQSEHHASAESAPLPQFDPALQTTAGMQQQPVQSHTANLTAVAVAPTQTALASNTPVPMNSLAADIALRAAGGNSRFEIRLDPAELGRIDVRLDVDKHGNVTSHLTVERPATLDMLRNDAPRLQQALENAGLKTGDSGLQFSLRDQSSSGQNNDNGSGRNSQRVIITDEDTVPAQVAGRSYGRALGSSSGVDIRI